MKRFILCIIPLGTVSAAHLRNVQGHAKLVNEDELQPQTFRLMMNNHKGVQYTAPVTLANQEFMAVYDTGSFEVMAVSRRCKACNLPQGLGTYDNKTSDSFKKGNRPLVDHQFAGGLVVARQDFETVHVGTRDSVFKVQDMPFWQVVDTDMAVWMNQKASFNAIVGLGHRAAPPDTPEGQKPMESLIERTGTQKFAICLERGPANPGYLTFSPQYDFQSDMFRRISVVGRDHWAVILNSVAAVKGHTSSTACGGDHPCVAIIDSGTSLIGVPPSAAPMVSEVIKQVKYDCSNLDQLPDLVFEIDGKKFKLPGSAYTVQFGGTTEKPERCLPAFTDFAMTSEKGDVWILGMPFLRHFYTVFDRKEPSIYVAEQGPNCEPAAPHDAPAQGTFLNATSMANSAGRATIVDMGQARLPSWANGQKHITL